MISHELWFLMNHVWSWIMPNREPWSLMNCNLLWIRKCSWTIMNHTQSWTMPNHESCLIMNLVQSWNFLNFYKVATRTIMRTTLLLYVPRATLSRSKRKHRHDNRYLEPRENGSRLKIPNKCAVLQYWITLKMKVARSLACKKLFYIMIHGVFFSTVRKAIWSSVF